MPTLKRRKKNLVFSFTPNKEYKTTAHRQARKDQLEAHPKCQVKENGKTCNKPGFSMDHIIPLRIWRKRKLSGDPHGPKNRQTVCRGHQFKKSAQDAHIYKEEYKELKS